MGMSLKWSLVFCCMGISLKLNLVLFFLHGKVTKVGPCFFCCMDMHFSLERWNKTNLQVINVKNLRNISYNVKNWQESMIPKKRMTTVNLWLFIGSFIGHWVLHLITCLTYKVVRWLLVELDGTNVVKRCSWSISYHYNLLERDL